MVESDRSQHTVVVTYTDVYSGLVSPVGQKGGVRMTLDDLDVDEVYSVLVLQLDIVRCANKLKK